MTSSGKLASSGQVDHLVVAAHDLEQGARWCLDTLGVAPLAGGRHPLMATHNLLVNIGSEAWPKCYLEIIAIDPHADTPPMDGRRRWFGLDDPVQQTRIRRSPCLVHFVARVPQIEHAITALAAAGDDVGEIVAASRQTRAGTLHWRISVRRDGVPQYGGSLPTLIEWGGAHPTSAMDASGVCLHSLHADSERRLALQRAWDAIGLASLPRSDDGSEPGLEAVLQTPVGQVRLRSSGG